MTCWRPCARPPRFGAFGRALSSSELIAFRDPYGVRPLAIGQLPDGGWCVASETCAFDQIGATYVRDVVPGEAIRLSPDGIESIQAMPKADSKLCVFETIYFARPDSIIDNQAVWDLRSRMGRQLAIEAPVDADLVVGLPDSARLPPSAFERVRHPVREGVRRSCCRRNLHPTRTAAPSQQRSTQVQPAAQHPRRQAQSSSTIIVRGTTIQQVIRMFEDAGAIEVHLRIQARRWPPFTASHGHRDDIAADNEVESIREEVGATSSPISPSDGWQTARPSRRAPLPRLLHRRLPDPVPVRRSSSLEARRRAWRGA